MTITFGDDAAEAFRNAVQQIPAGYTVALLGEHDEPPVIGGEYLRDVDVRIVATTPEGVAYRNLGDDDEPVGPVKIRVWEELERVHVY